MSYEDEYRKLVEQIVEEDPRYSADAYDFVREAVSFTTAKVYSDRVVEEGKRHVTGPQLAAGFGELALRQFGPLAIDVLEAWGLRTTEDIGNIVFNLIDKKLLGASEEDSVEDFKEVYDFREALLKSFVEVGEPPADLPRIA